MVICCGVVLFVCRWTLAAMRRSPEPEAQMAAARFDAALDSLRKAVGHLVKSVLHNG